MQKIKRKKIKKEHAHSCRCIRFLLEHAEHAEHFRIIKGLCVEHEANSVEHAEHRCESMACVQDNVDSVSVVSQGLRPMAYGTGTGANY